MLARRRPLAALVAVAVALAAAPAAAEIDNARADQLFLDGRRRLAAGDLAGACAQFARALEFNPQAISTRLNLAQCHERLGRIASAVAQYREVADRAVVQKLPEFEQLATARLAALTPELPHLAIHLPVPAARGTTVVVDDEVIASERLADVLVDPGDRVVLVTAPGRVAFRRAIRIAPRQRLAIDVPPLATRERSRRTIGLVTAGLGGAVAIGGIALAVVADRRYDRQFAGDDPPCERTTQLVCDDGGRAEVDSARRLGDLATVVTAVGITAIAVGGYLWWRAPGPRRERVSIVPHVAPDRAGVFAVGRF